MTILIGLTGYARSGKSTVAGILRERDNFVEHSSADPIRRMARDILGVSLAELDEIKTVPQDILGGKTPRFLMQTLGTEWGREMIAPDLWINVCMQHVARSRLAGNPVVISDVRFPNEAHAIRKAGGVIWRVLRPGVEVAAHASETSVDLIGADVVIPNLTDMRDLSAEVMAALDRMVEARVQK